MPAPEYTDYCKSFAVNPGAVTEVSRRGSQLRLTFLAPAVHDQVGAANDEAMFARDVAEHLGQVLALDVVGASALVADQVIVLARLGHLEELAFGQAAGADQSEALEDTQRSIDGCGVDALSLASQRRSDLLGAQVAACPAECVPNQLALARQAVAGGPQGATSPRRRFSHGEQPSS